MGWMFLKNLQEQKDIRRTHEGSDRSRGSVIDAFNWRICTLGRHFDVGAYWTERWLKSMLNCRWLGVDCVL